MINEWIGRRKPKCRRINLIMVGFTLIASMCVYILGTGILSPINHVESRHLDGIEVPYTRTPNGENLHQQQQQRQQRRQENNNLNMKYDSNIAHSVYGVDDEDFVKVDSKQRNRLEYEITNRTKRLPQAIIIGVKKAGTRALLEYLRLHPKIKAPGPEPHFFDKNYEKGLNWYRNLMPETFKGQLTIEKTPSYFVTKGIPERVFRMSKKMKLIVVFRDPVTRAISDYAQLASRNPVVKSFEEMVFSNNETKQIDTSWTIVKIGVYAQHLARWLDYFPIQQIHFVCGERLIENPAVEMEKIQTFLGLEQHITAENFTYNHTKGFPCYHRDRSKPSWHCLNNDKGRTHPNVSPEVLKRLQNFYSPFNRKLFNMIGDDYGWT